jgi:hypothetical protein
VDVLHRLLSEERIGVRTKLTLLRGSRKFEVVLVPDVRQA